MQNDANRNAKNENKVLKNFLYGIHVRRGRHAFEGRANVVAK